MSQSRHPAVSDDIDLATLGAALWRAKGWIAGLALGAGVLTFIGLSMMRPLYTSEARILVQNEDSAFTRPAMDQGRDAYRSALDEQAVQSQVQVLTSRDLVLQTVQDLDLVHNAAFARDAGDSLLRRLMGAIGLGRARAQSPDERAATALADHLDVFQLSKSSVIAVEYTSGDPQLAAKIANQLADVYLGWQRNAKIEQTKDATAWLDAQIKALRKATAESEEAVEAFKAKQGLYAGTNDVTLNAQQLSELNSQLILAGAQKSEAHARAQLIKKMLAENGDINATPAVLKSQLIINLIEQRVEVQRQLAELSATLLPSHPRIQQLRSELADVRAQIRDEAAKVVKSLENEAAVAAAREASLKKSLNAAKSTSAGLSDAEIKLRAFEREAKANRDLLESYLARYRDAAARHDMGAAPAQATIVSRAHAPVQPSFPKTGAISALVITATALLAIAATLAKDLIGTPGRPGLRYEEERGRPRSTDEARPKRTARRAPSRRDTQTPQRAKEPAAPPQPAAEPAAPQTFTSTESKPTPPSRKLPVVISNTEAAAEPRRQPPKQERSANTQPRQTQPKHERPRRQWVRQENQQTERTHIWRASKPAKRPSWLNVNETGAAPKPRRTSHPAAGKQESRVERPEKPVEAKPAAGLIEMLREEFTDGPDDTAGSPQQKNARFMDSLLEQIRDDRGGSRPDAAQHPQSDHDTDPDPEGAEMPTLSSNDLRHYLTRRIASSTDETATPDKPKRGSKQDSPVLKSLDDVLDKVLSSVTGGLPRALLVAGTAEKSDSPHAAIDIARALVDRNEQVVLVDLTKGASAVSGPLGMPRVPGFADLSAGRASFSDVIRVDDESALQVITAGNPAVRSTKPEPDRFMPVFEALTQTYGCVVLHADLQAVNDLLPALKFELPIMVAVVPPRFRLEKQAGALRTFEALGCPVVTYEGGGGRRSGLLGRIAAI